MATGFGGLIDAVAFGALNEVLGEIRGKDGMSRPNRYEVTLYPPTGSAGSTGLGSNVFSKIMGEALGDGTVRATGLKCESISFPGRNMDTTDDTNIYGPVRSIVTGYSFGDIAATFQCSTDMREKKYFESWQRLSFNPQTFAIGYYNDYVGSVDIHALDEQDNRTYGVKLIEAFPVSIDQQALSYAENTSYQTIGVNFKYRYWQNLTDEAKLPKPLLTRIAESAVNTVTRRITANIPSVLRRL